MLVVELFVDALTAIADDDVLDAEATIDDTAEGADDDDDVVDDFNCVMSRFDCVNCVTNGRCAHDDEVGCNKIIADTAPIV